MSRFITAYVAYVAAMNLLPGPWRDWPKGRYVDPWTVTHIAWGMVAKRMGIDLSTLIGLTVLNELGEAWLRANRPDLVWGSPETSENVIVDVAATVAGWKVL